MIGEAWRRLAVALYSIAPFGHTVDEVLCVDHPDGTLLAPIRSDEYSGGGGQAAAIGALGLPARILTVFPDGLWLVRAVNSTPTVVLPTDPPLVIPAFPAVGAVRDCLPSLDQPGLTCLSVSPPPTSRESVVAYRFAWAVADDRTTATWLECDASGNCAAVVEMMSATFSDTRFVYYRSWLFMEGLDIPYIYTTTERLGMHEGEVVVLESFGPTPAGQGSLGHTQLAYTDDATFVRRTSWAGGDNRPLPIPDQVVRAVPDGYVSYFPFRGDGFIAYINGPVDCATWAEIISAHADEDRLVFDGMRAWPTPSVAP